MATHQRKTFDIKMQLIFGQRHQQLFKHKHHRRVPAGPRSGGSCPWRKRDSVGHVPPAWVHSTGETAPRHRFSNLDPRRQHLQASSRCPKKETKGSGQSKVCKYLSFKISCGFDFIQADIFLFCGFAPNSKLSLKCFIFQIAPSSVFHNGTDIVYTVSGSSWY